MRRLGTNRQRASAALRPVLPLSAGRLRLGLHPRPPVSASRSQAGPVWTQGLPGGAAWAGGGRGAGGRQGEGGRRPGCGESRRSDEVAVAGAETAAGGRDTCATVSAGGALGRLLCGGSRGGSGIINIIIRCFNTSASFSFHNNPVGGSNKPHFPARKQRVERAARDAQPGLDGIGRMLERDRKSCDRTALLQTLQVGRGGLGSQQQEQTRPPLWGARGPPYCRNPRTSFDDLRGAGRKLKNSKRHPCGRNGVRVIGGPLPVCQPFPGCPSPPAPWLRVGGCLCWAGAAPGPASATCSPPPLRLGQALSSPLPRMGKLRHRAADRLDRGLAAGVGCGPAASHGSWASVLTLCLCGLARPPDLGLPRRGPL